MEGLKTRVPTKACYGTRDRRTNRRTDEPTLSDGLLKMHFFASKDRRDMEVFSGDRMEEEEEVEEEEKEEEKERGKKEDGEIRCLEIAFSPPVDS